MKTTIISILCSLIITGCQGSRPMPSNAISDAELKAVIEEAHEHLNRNRYKEARTLVQDVYDTRLLEDEQKYSVSLLLGFLWGHEDEDKSIEYFRKAYWLKPDCPDAWKLKATIINSGHKLTKE